MGLGLAPVKISELNKNFYVIWENGERRNHKKKLLFQRNSKNPI